MWIKLLRNYLIIWWVNNNKLNLWRRNFINKLSSQKLWVDHLIDLLFCLLNRQIWSELHKSAFRISQVKLRTESDSCRTLSDKTKHSSTGANIQIHVEHNFDKVSVKICFSYKMHMLLFHLHSHSLLLSVLLLSGITGFLQRIIFLSEIVKATHTKKETLLSLTTMSVIKEI